MNNQQSNSKFQTSQYPPQKKNNNSAEVKSKATGWAHSYWDPSPPTSPPALDALALCAAPRRLRSRRSRRRHRRCSEHRPGLAVGRRAVWPAQAAAPAEVERGRRSAPWIRRTQDEGFKTYFSRCLIQKFGDADPWGFEMMIIVWFQIADMV